MHVPSSDGTTLFCEVEGHGIPLLFCDGLLCDGHVWKYTLPMLKEIGRCIHWTYPGHGGSNDPPPFADLSIERLADDGACILEYFECEKAVIIGHSLGVQVALEMWKRHAELVSGLVLICGSPGEITRSFYNSQVWHYLVPQADLLSKFLAHKTMKFWKKIEFDSLIRWVMHTSAVNRRLVKASDLIGYLSRLNRVDLRVALGILESAGRHDATPYLKEIAVPALVLAGERDLFTPPCRSRLIASMIPNAELCMAKSGTHSLPLEQPDLVDLKIKKFIMEEISHATSQ